MVKSNIVFNLHFTSSKVFALVLLFMSLIVSIASKDWSIFQNNALIAASLYGIKTGLEGANKLWKNNQ